jgi:hypothetical protein
MSSVGWGPTPSNSTLVAPNDVSSAPDIYYIGASYVTDVGSSDVGDTRGTTTSYGEPMRTMARSPAFVDDDTTRGTYGDVSGCAAGR